MSLVIVVVEDLHDIQTTGEMKDPPFQNSWLFHFSVTFGFSGSRIMDLTGSLYVLTEAKM